jgi:capsid protein
MPEPLNNLAKSWQSYKDAYRSEYSLYQPSRFRRTRIGVSPIGAGADWHVRVEGRYFYGMEYVRDMHRNDVMVLRTTECAVEQQVQNGFTLDVRTGDDKLNEDYRDDFLQWAQDPDLCDISGEMAFADYEQACYRGMLVDGDDFVSGLEDGRLQFKEGHLCRTPTWTKKNVALGVQMDDFRRREGFYFIPQPVDPWKRTLTLSEMKFESARDEEGFRQVFQVYHAKRVTLTRGMTAYHPIVDVATMFEDTNFALLVKQQMAACLGIFFEQTSPEGGAYNPQLGERSQQVTPSRTLNEIINETIAPGQKTALPFGVKPHVVNPNIPSTETMGHMRFLLQMIGLNLGLPLVLVLLDASETNFSGWRGALDAAHVGFRTNQRQFVRRFHRPLYRWRLHWRMLQDDDMGRNLRSAYKRLGEKLFQHHWGTPNWPYVQPLDDAKADAFQLQNLLSSPRRILANKGMDIGDVIKETIEDNGKAILAAKAMAAQINQQHPDDPDRISWRDILNRDIYRGGQLLESMEAKQTEGGSKQRQ